MPLSKKRDRERARERRRLAKQASNLAFSAVQPKVDAPQSKSSGIKSSLNTTAPLSVQPIYDPDIKEDIVAQVKRLYPDKKIPNCPNGRCYD